MPAGHDTALDAATRKLRLLADLGDGDCHAIAALPYQLTRVTAATYLVREGSVPSECCLLVEGYACRHKLTALGGRQIVSFHLSGDILDLQHLFLHVADHNVQTITDAIVAWIPKGELIALARARPMIAEALWKDTLIDASIFREWVLNVGRRDAISRIAHMICEFVARCEATGLGSADRFDLPMTQEQIADATGLTSVHVNRMLRALDEEGVLARKGRTMQITDWTRLRRIADFDPAYLHAAAA